MALYDKSSFRDDNPQQICFSLNRPQNLVGRPFEKGFLLQTYLQHFLRLEALKH